MKRLGERLVNIALEVVANPYRHIREIETITAEEVDVIVMDFNEELEEDL